MRSHNIRVALFKHYLAIPGRTGSFGVIEATQAAGDFHVLAERGAQPADLTRTYRRR
jgi:hypothetical protein